ncbi:uncharacterized protein LOC121550169 isoform X2 [Coregonus clupeaformis]|uniref:uncharacterized protein LOC121550169 isoform X2 n=1 Tax=Coregonus clupeaformis TaxID=59861 RepID=UPI001E1C63FF|nr:uncharacterized protein LOC121550169 isoform X2 [Coregonus clupeaformis]
MLVPVYSMAAMSTCLSLSPQSGRVTRLIERNYDEVISSSNSDDFSIDSFTDCESECDDEDHERRTPLLKVKDEEDGKVAKLEVRDMVEDDDLSLHSFDESDFLRDDGNDASTDDFPEPPKEPQVPLKDHQLVGVSYICLCLCVMCVTSQWFDPLSVQIIVAKHNIPLPASVSALKKASRQMEVVPTVRPCREQLDKNTPWTNTNKESLRRIEENLTSIVLNLEEGLKNVNDGQDINQERQKKNEGCCRGWIAKWMGWRKKERLSNEDVDREVKRRMGEEVRALIQVTKRNCRKGDLKAVDLNNWLNDLERLKVAFKKCTGEMAEMIDSMAEMQTSIAKNRLLKPEKNNYVQSFSPGKVSGPVSGKTGLSPLVTSAPRTLAEALRALPSAMAPPSPENVPMPLTPLSPVIIALPATENFLYRRSPRLAPITNLSETGRKLLQEMAQEMAGVAPHEGKINKKRRARPKNE